MILVFDAWIEPCLNSATGSDSPQTVRPDEKSKKGEVACTIIVSTESFLLAFTVASSVAVTGRDASGSSLGVVSKGSTRLITDWRRFEIDSTSGVTFSEQLESRDA